MESGVKETNLTFYSNIKSSVVHIVNYWLVLENFIRSYKKSNFVLQVFFSFLLTSENLNLQSMNA
jgi:hypothetical protein